MDEDHHGKILHVSRGLPDVEIERILAHRFQEVVLEAGAEHVEHAPGGERVEDRVVAHLHGHGGKVVAYAHALPALRLLRLAPAQLAHRRLGIGNAGVDLHRLILRVNAGQVALGNRHNRRDPRVCLLHGRNGTDRRLGNTGTQHQHHDQHRPHAEARQTGRLRTQADADKQIDADGGGGQDPAQQRVLAQLQHQRAHQRGDQ